MARGRWGGDGGWGDFPAYVPVAERKAAGQRELARRLAKAGRAAAPVVVTARGREIAETYWGRAWCENLERYSDYQNRLPRGRTYARNGSVLDLHITAGAVEAAVAGSMLYTVSIELAPLPPARWKQVIAACAGRIGSLIGLLRGELSPEVMAVISARDTGLFPAPREILMRCSCPDMAGMCKHIAATLYGVGARLDQEPELFFRLRQVDQAELLAGAAAADVLAAAGAAPGRTASGRRTLAPGALGSVFGIELEEPPPAPTKPKKPTKPTKQQPTRRAARAPRRAP